MSEQPQPAGRGLTDDDLEAERALELPDREAMSVLYWPPGAPLVHPDYHLTPPPPDPEVGIGDPMPVEH